MTTHSDDRKWPRHKVRHPVSFKSESRQDADQNWYFGETRDISVNGMNVVSSSVSKLPSGSELILLCFPQKISLPPYGDDPEPLWIKADIIWKDSVNNRMGLQIAS